MKSENRQAHTLFGVVSLFLIGHLFRMILNLHEVFMEDSVDSDGMVNETSIVGQESIKYVSGNVVLLNGNKHYIEFLFAIDIGSNYNQILLIIENSYGTGNTTMSGCLDPNRDCAQRDLKLWLLVRIICYCLLNQVEFIAIIAIVIKQSKQR